MTSSLKKIGNDASVWGQSTHPEVWDWWESILVSQCPLKPFLSVLSFALKSGRTSAHFNFSPGRLLVSSLNMPVVFINWYYGSVCIVLLPLLPVCWQYTQIDHDHPFSAWLNKPSAPLRRPGHVPVPTPVADFGQWPIHFCLFFHFLKPLSWLNRDIPRTFQHQFRKKRQT